MKKEIPFWEKSNLTIDEAASYFSIGMNKLRELSDDEDCDFVLWCGSKRLIKRVKLEKYLDKQYSI
ncbi:TPA: excisionase [Streptococcus agalactiae]|uniref:Excisionase family DNA binding protein n=1 Tax=Streptococcus dysgalactiae TaxID=1334 RepID=A0ABU0A6H8_STRDY|nr:MULTISPECIES: excisionase [Streptococcus]ADX24145.1 putative transposon excisionase [Streptococcus dysgalactiae subsp. equisimilis ATCC 12394]EGL47901.1 DNA binding domain, excisionase family [Streptococcus dysgalactiae subsp. equisimilis SK1249]HEM3677122.1 transposase [Streptococcus suis]KKC19022.1 transposase [Streptococcus dysgalactiae subsp. equisimilis]MCY7207620.1 transposase [Streptococcus dysgalactiae]